MNGFASHDLDEGAFGENSGLQGGLKTFDAFRGQWTVLILLICSVFSISEFKTWFKGSENHHFSVEKGVSHDLQLNLDIVVQMPCDALHVNIQDASGDRILAGELLKKDPTSWKLWTDKRNYDHEYQTLSREEPSRLEAQEEDAHVRHVLGEVRHNPRRKFPKGPKLRRGDAVDSCRIYGSLEGNKVQGDFHITARGHGYRDMGGHLDHSTTESHYYKYQYFLSVVPTIYSKGHQAALDSTLYTSKPSHSKNVIFTNQYAATSQGAELPENPYYIPGIFFKYNIEPILLMISEERSSFLSLLIRLVNTVSGVMVTGGWLYQIAGWGGELLRRGRKKRSEGVLDGKLADE
ncbi:unnamed protein product [Aspergillus oryzae var. brunneus]|uniref:Endoplasmic reticulum-Golgi intermediate compartment protein n=1 Tax=Aspergillus oryzae var. brunneus TaxID=332754 RepID=A0ABQ6KWQ6_ASPOZ|nr:unnamed protein product [Aspergillus oryzae var. brunneus]